jgi:hypothetical protein
MKKTCILLLSALLCSAAVGAPPPKTGATIEVKNRPDLSAVLYSVKTPSHDLTDVWIEVYLATYTENGKFPETCYCQFELNYGQTPAQPVYDLAHYMDGTLYLYFEKLEPFTLVQFMVGWRNEGLDRTQPHDAYLQVKANEWEKDDAWLAGNLNSLPLRKHVQITIDGPETCGLL